MNVKGWKPGVVALLAGLALAGCDKDPAASLKIARSESTRLNSSHG